jgi:hypothetical protein
VAKSVHSMCPSSVWIEPASSASAPRISGVRYVLHNGSDLKTHFAIDVPFSPPRIASIARFACGS